MKRSASSGVSSAGFRTTVFPQTSAGASFQAGIAIGKFHGVIAPTTPTGYPNGHLELVAELGRRRVAEHTPALAGHVDRHVDRLLDVPAGLREHLAHLSAHQLGQLLLLVLEQAREAEQDLAALRRRHEPPLLEGLLRRCDGTIDVFRAGAREAAERLAGRGDVRLEGLAGGGPDPVAADVVLELLRARDRHRRQCSQRLRVNTGEA